MSTRTTTASSRHQYRRRQSTRILSSKLSVAMAPSSSLSRPAICTTTINATKSLSRSRWPINRRLLVDMMIVADQASSTAHFCSRRNQSRKRRERLGCKNRVIRQKFFKDHRLQRKNLGSGRINDLIARFNKNTIFNETSHHTTAQYKTGR